MFKKFIAMCLLLAASVSAFATLQGGNSTTVQSIRIESGYGYVTLNAPATNCPRLYIDLTTAATSALNRAIYGDAMLAFATGKVIQIRAYDTDPMINGACKLFDIYLQY